MNETPELFVIGEVLKPHGVYGDVQVVPHRDGAHVIDALHGVYVRNRRGERDWFEVERVRGHDKRVLVKFAGVDTPEEARQRFAGAVLELPRSAAPPAEEGAFYEHELLGLRVVTDTGRELGTLEDIIETGANDVYVVRGESEVLLPAIDEVVVGVDIDAGRMVVHVLPGLLEP